MTDELILHPYKLGRNPSPRHLLRLMPRLGDFLAPLGPLPSPKPELDYSTDIDFPMFDNDKYGNCTIAALGHQEQVWTKRAGTLWTPDTSDIDDYYWKLGNNQDNGLDLLTVLNAWRTQGFKGHQIDSFALVNERNAIEVQLATEWFGGLDVGISLPLTARYQSVWDLTPEGLSGRGEPGSWGGHCINVVGYNAGKILFVSWGKVMAMTLNFWLCYVDEAYAVRSKDWVEKTGLTPSGLDWAALQQRLDVVSALQQ